MKHIILVSLFFLTFIGTKAQGEDMVLDHTAASGTLPLVYINTEDSTPIVDKVTPIAAELYITVPAGSEIASLGSEQDPVKLTIRGRGNSSWNFKKKPYKLKFEKKQPLLGQPKNKHFALIPYAMGYTEWLAATAGMEIARCTGMPWAPHIEPLELVLNGQYEGLYFAVESVKIDENRVNITKQSATASDFVEDGGWLVEIDNYNDDNQICIQEDSTKTLRVTCKDPENMTPLQAQWLMDEFQSMNDAIYSGDPMGNAWAELIDPISVAQYFIVRELLHDSDGYNGSLYLHKDFGEKWHFGPMWDLIFEKVKTDWIMNDHPSYSQIHWIEQLFLTGRFQSALREVWEEFIPFKDHIFDVIDQTAAKCAAADKANEVRWPGSPGSDTFSKAATLKNGIKSNIDFISRYLEDLSICNVIKEDLGGVEYYNLSGIRVDPHSCPPGIYIRKQGLTTTKILKH